MASSTLRRGEIILLDQTLLFYADWVVKVAWHKLHLRKDFVVKSLAALWIFFILVLHGPWPYFVAIISLFMIVSHLRDAHLRTLTLSQRNFRVLETRQKKLQIFCRLFMFWFAVGDGLLYLIGATQVQTWLVQFIYASIFYVDAALYPDDPPPKKMEVKVGSVVDIWV